MDKYFSKSILTKRIQFHIALLTNDIEKLIHDILVSDIESKCVNEGFIRKNSIQILSHSVGEAIFDQLFYDVVFQCDICYPVNGHILDVFVKNITKAGVRAIISEEDNPIVVFVARDLHLNNDHFHELAVDDAIQVQTIGTRFEYGDPCIYVIAELITKN